MKQLTKAKKTRYGPNLDKYIKDEKRRSYMTYRKASVFYSIPYPQMVRLAKEADACWKIRKTVLVDADRLDIYLEKFRLEDSDSGI